MIAKPEYGLAFRSWLNTPLGRKFNLIEHEVVTSVMPNLCGYQAVILGEMNFAAALPPGHIKVTSLVNSNVDAPWSVTPMPAMCARYDKLAIDTEIIDCVYIAHCLEFSNNPNEILREAHRIMRPDGHLLITILNPFSSWGMWRNVARFSAQGPWRANFMSLIKLKDWLALLGFDIMQVKNFGFCLPFHYGEVANELTHFEKWGQKVNLPFGAAYMIEACKSIIPVTPIKPLWMAEREIAAHDDAAEPTV